MSRSAASGTGTSTEQFLKFHTPAAQHVADMTGEVTELWRRPDGTAGMTVPGYPQPGMLIARFTPAQDRDTLRARFMWRTPPRVAAIAARVVAPSTSTVQ